MKSPSLLRGAEERTRAWRRRALRNDYEGVEAAHCSHSVVDFGLAAQALEPFGPLQRGFRLAEHLPMGEQPPVYVTEEDREQAREGVMAASRGTSAGGFTMVALTNLIGAGIAQAVLDGTEGFLR